ncbi:ABC transporter substrate-binding protein [Nocardioides sp. GY 10113]|uniref:ABC transporter substrate-binding protein n=1 Tax=Nocardioides sp. GY 10113 TaxID=2569761 RepID=UPI0010A87E23|nr:ABC transporter substrate-binding protein [Nocardioides sp. GY 10113]TIC85104.1 ABC transporter substrate-binding protein [Nocardioides sp. GY 10113]
MKSSLSHRSRLTAALLVSTLAVAGCATSSPKSDGGTKDSSTGGTSKSDIYTTGLVNVDDDGGEPQEGGTLTVADYGEPRSLDPTVTYANGATGGSALAAVYDTLMRFDFDTNEYVPQLAESLTSDDNVTWTLKLRPGVTFTDGTPLDADAVLGSLEYYNGRYGYQSLLMSSNVAKTTKVDDLTVTFTLYFPWTTFPNMLAGGPGMILAPAAYQDPQKFEPIGAGPFTFDKYAPGEELVLTANEDYFNGAPHLDALRFIWLGGADDQAKLDALESGDADTAYIRNSRVVEEAHDAGLSGMMNATGLGDALLINNRDGRPGADLRVRQAINYAFDPVTYVERVREGAGMPTKSLFPTSSPWYTGVEPTATDPEKAKELLAEAMADGYDGKISYTHGADAASQSAAVTIKAMLEAVGFEVTLDPLRSIADQVQKLYIDHDYDLGVAAMNIPDMDPYSRLAGGLGASSPSNTTGYSSQQMDNLLLQLQAAEGPEDGMATMKKIEELWDREVPGVGIAAGGTFEPWNDNVHGIVPTTETMFLYDQAWKE